MVFILQLAKVNKYIMKRKKYIKYVLGFKIILYFVICLEVNEDKREESAGESVNFSKRTHRVMPNISLNFVDDFLKK